jgi:metal-responsive CopG/Arc/MetJ family transcriptional regulator
MIKPVFYSDQIATFEAAIKAVGIRNRAEALIEICRVYLEHQRTTEGQFDLSAKI